MHLFWRSLVSLISLGRAFVTSKMSAYSHSWRLREVESFFSFFSFIEAHIKWILRILVGSIAGPMDNGWPQDLKVVGSNPTRAHFLEVNTDSVFPSVALSMLLLVQERLRQRFSINQFTYSKEGYTTIQVQK